VLHEGTVGAGVTGWLLAGVVAAGAGVWLPAVDVDPVA
jgi:hypothetical protein